jgi:branched-chain amino acid transport system substrate-binding protein
MPDPYRPTHPKSKRKRGKTVIAALVGGALVFSTTPSFGATKKAPAKKGTTTTKATTPKATAAPAATTAPSASGGLGKQADGTYLGKSGFKVDLSKCPKDYDVNQGITDKEVRAFLSLPKSGPLAGFGLIADGMNSYFKYINDQGGVAGRKVVLDVKDDLYEAAKTKANVTEAIASGKYAALVTTLGTPNNLAIWDDTNKECMPQLLNGTGAAQWGDVDGHPWTTGMQLDYTTEAILWAEWIKAEFPKGAKVAMLTYNNDFGLSYSRGFRVATKGTNIQVVKEEFHEATAPNLTNQFTNIDSTLPDVVLVQTTGAFCTQAMAELEKRNFPGKVMLSGTCGSLSQFFKPLIDQGLTGKDTYILSYLKDINDSEWQADPFVKLVKATLKAQGLDPNQSTYATGWVFAWYWVELLRLAATYDGGLNRPNIMLAGRALDKVMPLALPGVTNKMDGLKDAYLNESARVARYKVRDPKELGTWYAQGQVINKEGSLGTYKKFKEATGS